MAAQTSDAVRIFHGEAIVRHFKVAANAILFPGAGVVVDVAGGAAGYAFPAGNRATACKTVGVCLGDPTLSTKVDNTGGAAGAKLVAVKLGTAGPFLADATNPPTQAHVGRVVFWADDQTLAHTATNSRQAGQLVAVKEDGLYIDMTQTANVTT